MRESRIEKSDKRKDCHYHKLVTIVFSSYMESYRVSLSTREWY